MDFDRAWNEFNEAKRAYTEALVANTADLERSQRRMEEAFVVLMRALGQRSKPPAIERGSVADTKAIALLRDKLAKLRGDMATLRQGSAAKDARIVALERSQAELERLLEANATRRANELRARVRELEAQLAAASRPDNEALRRELDESRKRVSELEGQIAASRGDNEARQRELDESRARVRELEAQIAASRGDNEALQSKLDELRAQLASRRELSDDDRKRMQDTIDELRRQVQANAVEKDQLNNQLAVCQRRERELVTELVNLRGAEESEKDFDSARSDDVIDEVEAAGVFAKLGALAAATPTGASRDTDVSDRVAIVKATIELADAELADEVGAAQAVNAVNFLVTKLATGMEAIDDDDSAQAARLQGEPVVLRGGRTTSFFAKAPEASSSPSGRANRLEINSRAPLEGALLKGGEFIPGMLDDLYKRVLGENDEQFVTPLFPRVFGADKFAADGSTTITAKTEPAKINALQRKAPVVIDASELDEATARRVLGASFVRSWASLLAPVGTDVWKAHAISHVLVEESFFKPLELAGGARTTLFELIGRRPSVGAEGEYLQSAALPYLGSSKSVLEYLRSLARDTRFNLRIGKREFGFLKKRYSSATDGRVWYAGAALELNRLAGDSPLEAASPVLLIIPNQAPPDSFDGADVADFVRATALAGDTGVLEREGGVQRLFGDGSTAIAYERVKGAFGRESLDKSVLVIDGKRFVVDSKPKQLPHATIIFVKSWEGVKAPRPSGGYEGKVKAYNEATLAELIDDMQNEALGKAMLDCKEAWRLNDYSQGNNVLFAVNWSAKTSSIGACDLLFDSSFRLPELSQLFSSAEFDAKTLAGASVHVTVTRSYHDGYGDVYFVDIGDTRLTMPRDYTHIQTENGALYLCIVNDDFDKEASLLREIEFRRSTSASKAPLGARVRLVEPSAAPLPSPFRSNARTLADALQRWSKTTDRESTLLRRFASALIDDSLKTDPALLRALDDRERRFVVLVAADDKGERLFGAWGYGAVFDRFRGNEQLWPQPGRTDVPLTLDAELTPSSKRFALASVDFDVLAHGNASRYTDVFVVRRRPSAASRSEETAVSELNIAGRGLGDRDKADVSNEALAQLRLTLKGKSFYNRRAWAKSVVAYATKLRKIDFVETLKNDDDFAEALANTSLSVIDSYERANEDAVVSELNIAGRGLGDRDKSDVSNEALDQLRLTLKGKSFYNRRAWAKSVVDYATKLRKIDFVETLKNDDDFAEALMGTSSSFLEQLDSYEREIASSTSPVRIAELEDEMLNSEGPVDATKRYYYSRQLKRWQAKLEAARASNDKAAHKKALQMVAEYSQKLSSVTGAGDADLVTSVLETIARGDDDTATRAIDSLHDAASRGDTATRAYLTQALPRLYSALAAAALNNPSEHDAADNLDQLKERLE